MNPRHLWSMVAALAVLLGIAAALLVERHHVLELPPVARAIEHQSLYAVEQMLQRQQRTLRTVDGAPQLFPLPTPGSVVLLFNGRRGGLSADRIEALYDWVAEGGTLIVEPSSELLHSSPNHDDADRVLLDPLLAPLNLVGRSDYERDDNQVDWARSARAPRYVYGLLMDTCYPPGEGAKAARAPHSDACREIACEPDGPINEQWFRWPGQPPRAVAFDGRLALRAPLLQRSENEEEEEPAPVRKQQGTSGHSSAKRLSRTLTTVTKQAGAERPDDSASKRPLQPAVTKSAAAERTEGERKSRPFSSRSAAEREAALRAMHQRLQSWPMTLERLVGDEQRAHLLDVRIGDGRVVVMSDLAFWGNGALQYLDHAWLLGELMGDAQALWSVQGFDEESLLPWLWQRASAFWLLLAALIGLCIWHALPRRQPLLERHAQQPSDLRAHFSAGSRLLWRAGQQDALLAPLRQRVQQLRQRHPALATDDNALAQHAGLTPAQLQAALHQLPTVPLQLIALINDLQQIRRSL